MSVIPLKDEMIRILSSPITRAIRFNFQSTLGSPVAVNSLTFQRVVDGLRNNRFVITSNGVPDGGAAYHPEAMAPNEFGINALVPDMSGTFKIKRGGLRVAFESLVVHESVHASFDMMGTVMPWVDNEAAAHIAQGFYYSRNNVSHYSINFEPVRIATQLAAYLDDSGFLDAQILEELRRSLRTTGIYQHYIHGVSRGNG